MTDAGTPPSERTRVRRLPERGDYDRATVDAIVDESADRHLAWVTDDGYPRVQRRSTLGGRHAVRARLDREPDPEVSNRGARSASRSRCSTGSCSRAALFHHSMNYRSVVVYGHPREVVGPIEKGRSAPSSTMWRTVAPPTPHPEPARARSDDDRRDPARRGLGEGRTGPPKDDEEDLDLPVWAGVLRSASCRVSPCPRPTCAAARRSRATSPTTADSRLRARLAG
jgi:hypothetical protein